MKDKTTSKQRANNYLIDLEEPEDKSEAVDPSSIYLDDDTGGGALFMSS